MAVSKEELSQRIRAGMAAAKARGVRVGGLKKYHPDEALVRSMLYAGKSRAEIARLTHCPEWRVRQVAVDVGVSHRRCKNGHIMAQTRRRSSNGDTYCGECRKQRREKEQKLRTPEYNRRVGRRSRLKTSYGLTIEQYDEMLATQNGVCAICKRGSSNKKHLHVDHCHATGKVRGLLCHYCNIGIGYFQDDPNTLQRCILYLNRANAS